jgi:hypothetical protein
MLEQNNFYLTAYVNLSEPFGIEPSSYITTTLKKSQTRWGFEPHSSSDEIQVISSLSLGTPIDSGGD